MVVQNASVATLRETAAFNNNIIVGDWSDIADCPERIARTKTIPRTIQWTTVLPQWQMIGSLMAQDLDYFEGVYSVDSSSTLV